MTLNKTLISCALGATIGLGATAAAVAKPHVSLLMPTQSVQYWALYVKGFQKEAQAQGIDVDVKVTNYDATEQATQVEQAIAQKPDVLVLVPVDSSAMVPSIRKINQAKIPLVISNSMPDAKYARYWQAFTGPNDVSYGEQAAKAMINGFKDKGYGANGKVLVINGQMGTPPQLQRYQGFTAELQKSAPGIQVAGALPADWDTVKAESAASALFTQYKDVKGVFAENDAELRGVVTAAERLGLDPSKLVLVGLGCDAPVVDLIVAGKAYATIDQSPVEDGAMAARAAKTLATGGTPKAIDYLPNPIATKSNVNVCYSQQK
ncbi:sugar ABC transporter substrate-binding protein [Pararobbsia silviterrae]|uniref:LacI family transcriptional regulator n=1 Tax=Pararobbsia silviterrae TaxID=1792498 RepID=A0A494YAU8_9BURK|nr:sugar ABC transporter substrate-binding protein [Pararobbsia silviterrae]RKP57765.1 LacI family transcriptional regulator [Pararobbsia silviterrae]